MNEDSDSILSSVGLRSRFPELSDAELKELRRALAEDLSANDWDLIRDAEVDRVLRAEVSDADEPVPPLPERIRTAMETARLERENQSRGADLYALPKRYGTTADAGDAAPVSRWHTASVVAGGLAVAAAITVAYVSLVRPVTSDPVVPFAGAVTLLTPGEETSFLEPVFTWDVDVAGVVDVRVVSPDGAELAALEDAFSPLRWSAFKTVGAMQPGGEYRLEISSPEGLLASRRFRIVETAQGSPEPAGSLDGILRQCRQLLSENRPADAWMLWAELTTAQKDDPRMQELKEQILAVLAG